MNTHICNSTQLVSLDILFKKMGPCHYIILSSSSSFAGIGWYSLVPRMVHAAIMSFQKYASCASFLAILSSFNNKQGYFALTSSG